MPYLCAHFDENVNAVMHDAAQRIAGSSAFTPEQLRFHVPLIGSLHVYSQEHITSVIEQTLASIHGHFVKWTIQGSSLRAMVELSEGAPDLLQQLQQTLPRGRPWRSHYVTLGSVAGIDAARHKEFVEAVEAAFPIDKDLHFALAGRLMYHNAPQRQVAMAKAKPCVTKLVDTKTIKKSSHPIRRCKHASPHRTWHRDAEHSTGSSVDALIRMSTGGTGSGTAGRAIQAKRGGAVSRSAKVREAREVWMAGQA